MNTSELNQKLEEAASLAEDLLCDTGIATLDPDEDIAAAELPPPEMVLLAGGFCMGLSLADRLPLETGDRRLLELAGRSILKMAREMRTQQRTQQSTLTRLEALEEEWNNYAATESTPLSGNIVKASMYKGTATGLRMAINLLNEQSAVP